MKQYIDKFGYYGPCGYIEYDCMGETTFDVPLGGFWYEVPKPDPGYVVPKVKHVYLMRPFDATYTVLPKGYRYTVPAKGMRYTVPARKRTFATAADLRYTVAPRSTRYVLAADARYTVTPKGYRYIVRMKGSNMATGAFWNIDAPNKPWGPLDPNGSVLPIPIDWEQWLAEVKESYGSHVLTADPLLEVVTDTVQGGVIYVKVRFKSPPVVGQYYPLLCHILTDATPPSEEDQTLWFKAVAK